MQGEVREEEEGPVSFPLLLGGGSQVSPLGVRCGTGPLTSSPLAAADELTVPRYRTEKPSKSPPPPPPRRSFPSSHGLTTTRTGEVVVTSKKDSTFIKVPPHLGQGMRGLSWGDACSDLQRASRRSPLSEEVGGKKKLANGDSTSGLGFPQGKGPPWEDKEPGQVVGDGLEPLEPRR